MSGSIGIVMAIGVSAVLGWFLILGLLFSIQNLDGTLSSETGQPVTQIFLDTVGEKGAIVLMVIVIGAMYFCGWALTLFRVHDNWLKFCGKWKQRTFSITSNSRMMYAFARDGGIPGHNFFAKVNPQWKSPIRTGTFSTSWTMRSNHWLHGRLVWLACTLSFILGLPSLGSSVAFAAATSIATIGLYISYGKLGHRIHASDLTTKPCTRYPDRSACHIWWPIHPRTISSRNIFVSSGHRCRSMDCFHFYRLHSSTGQRKLRLSLLEYPYWPTEWMKSLSILRRLITLSLLLE